MSTSLTEFYQLEDDNTVKLKIAIGHAQEGVTTVKLGTQELEHNKVGSLEKNVGAGKELNGKTLFCTTTVADVRTQTNETSIT